jgi:hypothetical protein
LTQKWATELIIIREGGFHRLKNQLFKNCLPARTRLRELHNSASVNDVGAAAIIS